MSNQLSMAKQISIEALSQSGHSNREISRLLGVDRGTVRKVVDRLNEQSTAIQNQPQAPTGSELDGALQSRSAFGPESPVGKSQCKPFRKLILSKLDQGLSARRIHQDLKREHDFRGSYYSARAIMKEASQLQRRMAESQGAAAVRRVELLHARFSEDMPIRTIAELWCVDPGWLHHEYSKARSEFLSALLDVVAASQPSSTHTENQATCKELLEMLD